MVMGGDSIPCLGSNSVSERAVILKTAFIVLAIVGGQLSPVRGGLNPMSDADGRNIHQPLKQRQQMKCGLHSVCDLATHFCDTVMNTCVRCSDDCHPGRINGDSDAEEDCRKKCRVYYELKEEATQKRNDEKISTINEKSKHQPGGKNLQQSLRSLNLLTTDFDAYLRRLELLIALETIGVALIVVLLFIACLCLILLLRRPRGLLTVGTYSPIDIEHKMASR